MVKAALGTAAGEPIRGNYDDAGSYANWPFPVLTSGAEGCKCHK